MNICITKVSECGSIPPSCPLPLLFLIIHLLVLLFFPFILLLLCFSFYSPPSLTPGLPVLIVTITLASASGKYSADGYCWLSVQNGIIWGFAGPVIFIIMVREFDPNHVVYSGWNGWNTRCTQLLSTNYFLLWSTLCCTVEANVTSNTGRCCRAFLSSSCLVCVSISLLFHFLYHNLWPTDMPTSFYFLYALISTTSSSHFCVLLCSFQVNIMVLTRVVVITISTAKRRSIMLAMGTSPVDQAYEQIR